MEPFTLYHKDDSYSEFNVPLSSDLPLFRGTRAWQLSLSEISFHHRFLNSLLPKTPGLPSIAISLKHPRSAQFESLSQRKIVLPHETYSQFTLIWTLQQKRYNPTKLKVEPTRKDSIKFYYPVMRLKSFLYLHRGIAEYLFNPQNKLDFQFTEIPSYVTQVSFGEVDDAVYRVFSVQDWPKEKGTNGTFWRVMTSEAGLANVLASKMVESIFVQCPQIENGDLSGLDAALEVIHPNYVQGSNIEKTRFRRYEIERPSYFTLNIKRPGFLTIRLCDQNGRALTLDKGPPTLIKLNFRPEPEQRDLEFTIRVTSFGSNNVEFTKHFEKDFLSPFMEWTCALTSFCLPNAFQTGLKQSDGMVDITVYDINAPEEEKLFNIQLPPVICSTDDLINLFVSETDSLINAGDSYGAIWLDPGRSRQITVELNEAAFRFLGADDEAVANAERVASSNNIIFRGATGAKLEFTHPPRIHSQKPSLIKILCAEVESVYGSNGKLSPVLREVAMNLDTPARNVSYVFKQPHFAKVVPKEIRKLHFALKNENDEPLALSQAEDRYVQMNLLFRPLYRDNLP